MNKKDTAGKFLVFGIMNLICGIYFFAPSLFTLKSSLIIESGKIKDINTFYHRVSSRGSKSTKSELKITLKNNLKTYYIMENIGQERNNKIFEDIKRQLTTSKEVKIWIKKTDQNKYKPEVFGISNDKGKILFSFHQAKSRSRIGFLITFLAGIFGIVFFLLHKHKIKNTTPQPK
ncbi:hypothetical protein [Tenacibaculum sp.]|uniref:hypothetical protein n=1 Tax=Tenacibaculum sp. TaxID=1906242 RepID=UPI003AA86109